MPVGENLKSILDKLPAEKRAIVEKAFSEVDEITSEIESGILRQSDYTRKTQELSAHRKQIDDDWNTANAEYQRMLKENQDMQSSLLATKSEKEDAAAKLAAAEKKLTEMPAIDPAKFVTPEQLKDQMQKLTSGYAAYTGRTIKVLGEHRKLFGEDLDAENFMREAAVAGKDPEEYWQDHYKVADKRKEIADTAKAKELADAEQRGYQKRAAEEANPATRTLKSSEMPFYTPKEDEKESPWDASVMTTSDTKFMEDLVRVTGS